MYISYMSDKQQREKTKDNQPIEGNILWLKQLKQYKIE